MNPHAFITLLLLCSTIQPSGANIVWLSLRNAQSVGTWGPTGECGAGILAFRVSGDFGMDASEPRDRMGMYSINFYCSGDGTQIVSSNADHGQPEPGGKFNLQCPQASNESFQHIYAIQLRVDNYGADAYDSGSINGIRIFCSGNGSRDEVHAGEAVENPDRGGEWHRLLNCGEGMSVCGFQTMVQPPQVAGGDDLGITAFRIRCCNTNRWTSMFSRNLELLQVTVL